jgi:hypothetical protein
MILNIVKTLILSLASHHLSPPLLLIQEKKTGRKNTLKEEDTDLASELLELLSLLL